MFLDFSFSTLEGDVVWGGGWGCACCMKLMLCVGIGWGVGGGVGWGMFAEVLCGTHYGSGSAATHWLCSCLGCSTSCSWLHVSPCWYELFEQCYHSSGHYLTPVGHCLVTETLAQVEASGFLDRVSGCSQGSPSEKFHFWVPDRLQRCFECCHTQMTQMHPSVPQCVYMWAWRQSLTYATPAPFLRRLEELLWRLKKVATFSDDPISYVVSKMLRNQHFASAKLSFQANLLGIDHDSTDETLGTSLLKELRTFRHDSPTTIMDLHHGRLSAVDLVAPWSINPFRCSNYNTLKQTVIYSGLFGSVQLGGALDDKYTIRGKILLQSLAVCTRTLCIKSLVSEALVAIFSWGLRLRSFLELRCLDEPSASYFPRVQGSPKQSQHSHLIKSCYEVLYSYTSSRSRYRCAPFSSQGFHGTVSGGDRRHWPHQANPHGVIFSRLYGLYCH